jgi:hypothetical protein
MENLSVFSFILLVQEQYGLLPFLPLKQIIMQSLSIISLVTSIPRKRKISSSEFYGSAKS